MLAVVAALVWWFQWRPLPDTSGVLDAPVSANAQIRFDGRGVPHIRAATIEDAIFLQGYVTAQDRMFQMDALRRLAAGELSEVIGKLTLEADQESRRLRLRRLAEQHEKSLTPGDRAILAAYARGVNHYLATHRDRLPMEFAVLDYDPRPWSVKDTLLAGLEMYRTLTPTWKDDLIKSVMREAGDPAKVDFLFPARLGREPLPGSNNWVVAGARSATGKPILANDTHLDFSLPATWYMVHLEAPGLNVAGFALPGAPGVIIGHNDRIAWGVTNMQTDVQDLYVEKMDSRTGRYEFRGQVEQARLEQDVLAVKGEKPRTLITWVTRHGPVVATEAGRNYALRWAAAEAGYAFPFLDINRARNWEEFRRGVARFPGPGQNFVYADVDGNIGYQASGQLPIRKTFQGDLPVDGASGDFEWEGFIPFDHLPRDFNPPSGMLVTANQNLFPADYKYKVNGTFEAPYRARQIRDLLQSRPQWKPEEMLVIQKDVYSAFSHWLAREIVRAWGTRAAAKPAAAEAIEVLRSWGGQMEKNEAAPAIVVFTERKLKLAVAERAAKGKGQLYNFLTATAVLEKLFTERPAGWFLDYDQTLVAAFVDAVDEAAKTYGSSPKRWNWGAVNQLRLAHPVLSQLPLVGGYFRIDAPMSGSPTTVKQIAQYSANKLGPSMRLIADLANWDASLANLTIGQSGHRLSSHYKDQWDAYYVGKSFPMEFGKVEVKATLEVRAR